MKKNIFFVMLVFAGLMTSCVDKNEEVDADSKPEWLHGSIYEELKNPTGLSGTFSTYLNLIDDLGYAETLNRTGSKTIFPANDEAFALFFANNSWGVSSYSQLTTSQKKLLLYSSMIDNALLVDMLPNVSNGSAEVVNGQAVKHATSVSVIDSVTHIYGVADMPRSNKYWTKYYAKGIDIVEDNTAPMMVHFTRAQMVNNNITTTGENSDFEILTGSPFTEGSAYIFDKKIIKPDITCQNGYIHQLDGVLIQPGNMAQVIRRDSETSIFSRVLDYFSAPFYDLKTTNNYNDWAITNGQPLKDSIFQMRYLSARSQESNLNIDPNGNVVSSTSILSYDPGWNQYYPSNAYTSGIDYKIADIGAFFVPDNNAMKKYFLAGGAGAYLIDIYGSKPNKEEYLLENLDSLQSKRPNILTSFVKNLMKSSFVQTVPSKFYTITNDASENMGMKMEYVKTKDSGKYDIKIANNGVIYVLNSMIAPDEYQAVLAPASSYPDMRIMNWAIQDSPYLGLDFKYYLLAMSANYAFFIPEDDAFNTYYVNPATLSSTYPEAIRFYFDEKKNPQLCADRYRYDPITNTVGERIGNSPITTTDDNDGVKAILTDILNFHTVILNDGETLGANNYYKTKHGGEICVKGTSAGGHVTSGAQIDNGLATSTIKDVYTEKNGKAYRLDNVIQPPHNSVNKTLVSDPRFEKFTKLCSGFSGTIYLKWAGISDEINSFGTTEQEQYLIFTSSNLQKNGQPVQNCLDENVKMFNTYNYTLYAPDNDALVKAEAAGLPNWDMVIELFEKYHQPDGTRYSEEVTTEETADIQLCYSYIKAMNDFCRYHFQTTSLYADNIVESGKYNTMRCNELGVADEINISGGNGQLIITDAAGVSHNIVASDGSKMVNKMARDYWLNDDYKSAKRVTTSSFCAIHEISEPLYFNASKRYDDAWSTRSARAKSAQKYMRLKANHKL